MEVGEENVILNCDYDFDEEEAQQLEIKWYFRKDPAPFFQWIAGLPDSKESLKSYLYLLTREGEHIYLSFLYLQLSAFKWYLATNNRKFIQEQNWSQLYGWQE